MMSVLLRPSTSMPPRLERRRAMMGRMPASPPEPAPADELPPPTKASAPAEAEASEPEARA
jgi:hypothetical protein